MKKQNYIELLIQSTLVTMMMSPAHAENWSGFYGGLNVGGVFNHATLRSQQLGFTDPSGTCDASSNYSSFFPGLQLGYSQQVPHNIVLGVEGSATFNTNQSTTLKCNCPFNSMVADQFQFKNRKQISLIGRIGYPVEVYHLNLLPFLTAGVSYADLGLNYRDEGGDYYARNYFSSGWRVGAGAEWAFYPHWSARAEYFYANYGKAIQMRVPVVYGLMDPNGSGHVNLTASYVEIALNYWI